METQTIKRAQLGIGPCKLQRLNHPRSQTHRNDAQNFNFMSAVSLAKAAGEKRNESRGIPRSASRTTALIDGERRSLGVVSPVIVLEIILYVFSGRLGLKLDNKT